MERAEDEFGSETAILPLSLLNAEHEIIASNIKQAESNPNNFFIVFLLRSDSLSRLYNIILNRIARKFNAGFENDVM